MKLVRFGQPGSARPGLLDSNGKVRDAFGVVADITPDTLSQGALDRLAATDPESLPLAGDVSLLAPIGHVGKVVCVGLNYSDHAAEVGMDAPPEPILFSKATTALTGPNGPIFQPPGSEKLDWEVELGIVIGKKAQHVEEAAALDHVAGYCLCNDVSERTDQLERGGQWVKGKSADGFGPIGPWLVTRDEIPDPQKLDVWLDVNGERQQTGTTARMIFNVVQLVSYISRFMTLMPGDVIMTGTPPGVGAGQKPPRFLKLGDVVTLGITGLGEQRTPVEPWRPNAAPVDEGVVE